MIKILSKETIQKIAAGEVIERPFSVVKELVENSIDAGATEIKVEISEGGLKLIKVTDNGSGIERKDIPLAIKRHATSKLDKFNDLYNISSLGFRGEALASITSISKTTIESKTEDEDIGSKYYFEGANLISTSDIGKNTGTCIIVEDLFYNIPVRKRFLSSTITEANLITSMMYRLAIGNYNIGFTYIKDDKEVFKTMANGGLKSNLAELFGYEFTKDLIEIDLVEKDFSVKGFISNNRYYRSNRSMEYLYVNGRFVKNQDINNVIEKSYGSLIPNGRFPAYQLFLEIKPSLIDVNIHPNKEKVSIVILDSIKNKLSSHLTKAIIDSRNVLNLSINEKKNDLPNLYEDNIKDLLNKFSDNSYVKEKDETYTNSKELDLSDSYDNEDIREEKVIKPNDKIRIDSLDILNKNKIIGEDKTPLATTEDIVENKDEDVEISSISFFGEEETRLRKYNYIGSIFKTYNIFESTTDEKIILMDQHAAHERIMFEKYLNMYRKKEVASQQLLSPILLNVNNEELNLFRKFSDMFLNLGFEVDEFSNDTLIIRGLPDLLELPKTKDLFTNILDRLTHDESSFDDSDMVNKVISMSCKAAIKSGDRMSELELINLLDTLLACENPLTCPHGRPTMVEVAKGELEKLFMRIK